MSYTNNLDHIIIDSFFTRIAKEEVKFLLIPRRCHFTKKWLWLEYAYKQTAIWTGPGPHIEESRYYDKLKFLIEKIKGTV